MRLLRFLGTEVLRISVPRTCIIFIPAQLHCPIGNNFGWPRFPVNLHKFCKIGREAQFGSLGAVYSAIRFLLRHCLCSPVSSTRHHCSSQSNVGK